MIFLPDQVDHLVSGVIFSVAIVMIVITAIVVTKATLASSHMSCNTHGPYDLL